MGVNTVPYMEYGCNCIEIYAYVYITILGETIS